ncbi:hypothetical protein J6590_023468 [Homalodisca vitripennis]|nr:hypothetical protein J6590_023468 [Homalodisca vitripennis]
MSRGFYFFSTVAVLVLAVAHKQTSELFPVDKDVSNSTPTSPTNTTGTRTTATLQLVIVFTRHGSRGPGFAYPTSPYQPQDTTYWPNGWTELTGKGHLQMYTLGKKFRSLYDGFLEEIYSPKDFQANSTLLERTMMSASLFLAGLFPSRDLHLYNTYFPWNTVPIYPTYKDHHDHSQHNNTTYSPSYLRIHLLQRKPDAFRNTSLTELISRNKQPNKPESSMLTSEDPSLHPKTEQQAL